ASSWLERAGREQRQGGGAAHEGSVRPSCDSRYDRCVWRASLCLLVTACSFQAREAERTVDAAGQPDAPAASAKRRVTLTFANPRAEALTSFAVLVALDAARIDYAACPGGANL